MVSFCLNLANTTHADMDLFYTVSSNSHDPKSITSLVKMKSGPSYSGTHRLPSVQIWWKQPVLTWSYIAFSKSSDLATLTLSVSAKLVSSFSSKKATYCPNGVDTTLTDMKLCPFYFARHFAMMALSIFVLFNGYLFGNLLIIALMDI